MRIWNHQFFKRCKGWEYKLMACQYLLLFLRDMWLNLYSFLDLLLSITWMLFLWLLRLRWNFSMGFISGNSGRKHVSWLHLLLHFWPILQEDLIQSKFVNFHQRKVIRNIQEEGLFILIFIFSRELLLFCLNLLCCRFLFLWLRLRFWTFMITDFVVFCYFFHEDLAFIVLWLSCLLF